MVLSTFCQSLVKSNDGAACNLVFDTRRVFKSVFFIFKILISILTKLFCRQITFIENLYSSQKTTVDLHARSRVTTIAGTGSWRFPPKLQLSRTTFCCTNRVHGPFVSLTNRLNCFLDGGRFATKRACGRGYLRYTAHKDIVTIP